MTAERKVLIITYYWPPASGPGVQRILKFAKYLPQFGWQPIVLTVKKGEYPALDETLCADVPRNCQVFRTASCEPNVIYKKFIGLKSNDIIPVAVLAEGRVSWKKKVANWLRLTLYVPDAKICWLPFAVRAGRRIIDAHKPDIILSSAPPPTVHLIAARLARRYGRKWIADFRDPWTKIHYYQAHARFFISRKLDALLERRVLDRADRVISVGASLLRGLKRGDEDDKYRVLYNGFDSDDFAAANGGSAPATFSIVYTGNLKANQNPAALWQALRELCEASSEFAAQLRLVFAGYVHQEVKKALQEFVLLEYAHFPGYTSHHGAIDIMRSAAALLFIVPDSPDNKGILTGKLFEYLAAGRPLLAIGPVDGDAAALLREVRGGEMLSPHESGAIRRRIEQLYGLWQEGRLASEAPDAASVSRYDRRSMAAELAAMMDELAGREDGDI